MARPTRESTVKRRHKTLLILGLVLIAVGVCLPLAGLLAADGEPADLSSSLWIAFWGLAVGIPLSALGCFLAALAVVLSRYRRDRSQDDRPAP